MDPFQALRLSQIFGQQTPPPFDQTITVPAEPDLPDPTNDPNQVNSWISSLYHPQTTNIDKLNTLVDSYPKEQPAGNLRKIGASLVGGLAAAGGNNPAPFQEEIMHPGYAKDVADWKNKVGITEKAAEVERQSNSNERQMAMATISDRLKQESEQHRQERDLINVNLKEAQARLIDWKIRNPTAKFLYPKGGNIQMVLPGQKPTDTGIATGTETDEIKAFNAQDNKLEQIEKTGEVQTKANESKGWELGTIPDPEDPTKQIGVRINKDTGETVPIKGGVFTKAGTKPANNASNIQGVQDSARESLNALNEILDDKGNLRPEVQTSVGPSRIFRTYLIPGTEARAGDVKITRLKSLLTLGLIQKMKDQSKTGSTGFGRLNLYEVKILENAASKLDPAMDEQTFADELKRIKDQLNKILQPADGMNPTITKKDGNPTAQDLLNKYFK